MLRAWQDANAASERLGRKAIQLLRDNAGLLALAVAGGVFAHGFELTHLTFSVDEEVMWQAPDNRTEWLIQQRWGMYLLQTLILPQTIFPFTTAALSILFLALSSVVFVRRTQLPSAAQAVFCLLFVSFPTFAHIQCFAYMGPHVAVAILLVVLAEKLFASTGPGKEGPGKLWRLAGSLSALTVATASHQSLVFVFPTLVLLALTIEAFLGGLSSGPALRRLAGGALLTVGAVVVHYGVILLSGLRSSGYTESYLQWGTAAPRVVLEGMLRSAIPFLTGRTFTYALMPSLLVPTLGLLIVAARAPHKALAAGSTLLTLLSLFAVHLVFGTWMSSRSMMTLPFVFAGFWALFFSLAAPALRVAIAGFTWYAVVLHSSVLSKASLDQEMSFKSDSLIASRILDLVYTVHPRIADDRTPLAFIGRLDPPRSKLFERDEALGGSFWQWDNGNPYRMYLFLRALGMPTTVELAPHAQWPRAAEASRDMPAWPDTGCVQVRDNVVIVKLSAP